MMNSFSFRDDPDHTKQICQPCCVLDFTLLMAHSVSCRAVRTGPRLQSVHITRPSILYGSLHSRKSPPLHTILITVTWPDLDVIRDCQIRPVIKLQLFEQTRRSRATMMTARQSELHSKSPRLAMPWLALLLATKQWSCQDMLRTNMRNAERETLV
eukprot:COSAG06_NODE_2262_length_7212_cov_7.977928_2_plen_156_part_00